MTAASVTPGRAGIHTPLPAWRKVLSFPVMLSCLLSALGVLTVRNRFDDPDLWWHLKTGQIIWTTHTIPTRDIFSYTTNHHAWVPHEWLAQTLIYGAYRIGGYSGLMFGLCLSTIVLLIAGYVLCTLYSRNAKVAFVGAMLIWFFSTTGLAIRPQMIGYCLLILELLLIQLGRTYKPLWFFLLPPLFAVWVNCHGSFFLGIVVACVFLVCSFFNFQIGSLVSLPWDQHRRTMLGLALILSAALLFLNPSGLRQVLYPLNTLFHQPIGLSHSKEWMPLTMTGGRGLGFLAVLGGIYLLTIALRADLFLDEMVLLALGTWLAVSHERMLFVFGILAAPIVSRLLSSCWDGYDAAQDHPVPNAVLIVISLLAIVWGFPSESNLTRQVADGSPVEAVKFIQNHHLSGPMLNDYVYGGYLIWSAPEYPVFVDGRADVYEWTGVLEQFGKWALLESDPKTLLDEYSINFCLLTKRSPMVHVLPLLPDWKMVYSSNKSAIFVRTSSLREIAPRVTPVSSGKE